MGTKWYLRMPDGTRLQIFDRRPWRLRLRHWWLDHGLHFHFGDCDAKAEREREAR